MTKEKFIQMWTEMYRVGNASDSDNREEWTVCDMARDACCRPLDHMVGAMLKCGLLTADEHQALYDNL